MSRSTAVLVSAVITGFLMVIAAAVATGLPGAGASDAVSPEEQGLESVAALQDIAAPDGQFADQFNADAIPAETLPTATVVTPPPPPAATALPPEESDVYLDLEWEMLLAQDRIAELSALNEALGGREEIYRQRVDEANAAIEEITESWSQPPETDSSASTPVTSSAPSGPPVAVQPTATPAHEPTPTPTTEPLAIEILPGAEMFGVVGEVAQISDVTVWTNWQTITKAAEVDWGDGSPAQSVVVIQETGEVLGFHVYREPGVYVIFVTAYVEDVRTENWTMITVEEPEVIATPEPTTTPESTATPAPAATATPVPAPTATSTAVPAATPTPGQAPPPPVASQPTGVTFDDAAYIARAISGELWIEKINIETEDEYQIFEVELDEAKVFIDTTTGVILGGEHILSSPVSPVPEPPAGMLNFDDAYNIAVNAHPGTVTRISQTQSSYTVRVSETSIRIVAYTGEIL